MWGAIAAAGGQLAGNIMQSDSQWSKDNKARHFNMVEARKNRKFTAQQAQINRQFQMNMSNTAYQRSTADMRKAGINPMLAFSQGGASTPSGDAGSGSQASTSASQSINPLEGVVSSALETKRLKKDIMLADQELQNKKAEESRTKVEEKKAALEAGKVAAENDILRAQEPAIRAESQKRTEEAKYQKDYIKVDSWINRAGAAAGAIGNIFGGAGKAAGGLLNSAKKQQKTYNPKTHYRVNKETGEY